ncbi:MAG: hypothetical protein AAB469_00790 [Patescibacteria group bacterium]
MARHFARIADKSGYLRHRFIYSAILRKDTGHFSINFPIQKFIFLAAFLR